MTVSSRSEYQFQTQYTSGHQGMAGLNFSNSDGLKLGSPLRNSGVLNAGGPPGCSLRRLYSPQLGAAAPYPTMPEAHILSKGSKNVLSKDPFLHRSVYPPESIYIHVQASLMSKDIQSQRKCPEKFWNLREKRHPQRFEPSVEW